LCQLNRVNRFPRAEYAQPLFPRRSVNVWSISPFTAKRQKHRTCRANLCISLALQANFFGNSGLAPNQVISGLTFRSTRTLPLRATALDNRLAILPLFTAPLRQRPVNSNR